MVYNVSFVYFLLFIDFFMFYTPPQKLLFNVSFYYISGVLCQNKGLLLKSGTCIQRGEGLDLGGDPLCMKCCSILNHSTLPPLGTRGTAPQWQISEVFENKWYKKLSKWCVDDYLGKRIK